MGIWETYLKTAMIYAIHDDIMIYAIPFSNQCY